MIHPVILAGGSGTRLWPLSRTSLPKQFIDVLGKGYTLFEDTVLRIDSGHISAYTVVTNEDYRFTVKGQLEKLSAKYSIILEPEKRNTAPAIALAAFNIMNADPEATIVVLPSDHIILDVEQFKAKLFLSLSLAEKGYLVTFGVKPTEPNTGYGYIRKGAPIDDIGNVISEFVEKPEIDRALSFFKDEDYLWNSGMFVMKASVYLEQLKEHAPDIYSACELADRDKAVDNCFIRPAAEYFCQCRADSIDYAVMEKSRHSAVIELGTVWDDIGSWSSVASKAVKDPDSNTLLGDVLAFDSENCYVRAESKLVTVLGVQDLVVVETTDAVLISHKDKSQEIKLITQTLEAQARSEARDHMENDRPWGKYYTVDNGDRYQVKRITVNPGHKLSLQMHHHRAEHWVVVKGTALVTKGSDTHILTENQSIYIPVGEIHSLHNPGVLPLELIEIQSGAYLGEDDIVRLDDIYGRA